MATHGSLIPPVKSSRCVVQHNVKDDGQAWADQGGQGGERKGRGWGVGGGGGRKGRGRREGAVYGEGAERNH